MAAVGFVGCGTMGTPMARHLIDAGHRVTVFDLHDAAMVALAEVGAIAAESAVAAASGADVVFLSLPGPPEIVAAVNEVLGAPELPAHVVDLSTNSVDAVRSLRQQCDECDVAFLDAPVSGGVVAAQAGTLTLIVGGEPAEVEAVTPLLEAFASTVLHVGPSGAGAIAKLVNNHIFLTAGLVVQEAYVLGQALGMPAADVHEIVRASSGGPYVKLAPLMLGRAFDDVIFRLDIAAKDLLLAVASAEAVGADAPIGRAASELYQAAIDRGLGAKAFHATVLELEHRAGVELDPVTRPPRTEG